jgi:hypothetical protein
MESHGLAMGQEASFKDRPSLRDRDPVRMRSNLVIRFFFSDLRSMAQISCAIHVQVFLKRVDRAGNKSIGKFTEKTTNKKLTTEY